jgi:hypothetical protein
LKIAAFDLGDVDRDEFEAILTTVKFGDLKHGRKIAYRKGRNRRFIGGCSKEEVAKRIAEKGINWRQELSLNSAEEIAADKKKAAAQIAKKAEEVEKGKAERKAERRAEEEEYRNETELKEQKQRKEESLQRKRATEHHKRQTQHAKFTGLQSVIAVLDQKARAVHGSRSSKSGGSKYLVKTDHNKHKRNHDKYKRKLPAWEVKQRNVQGPTIPAAWEVEQSFRSKRQRNYRKGTY